RHAPHATCLTKTQRRGQEPAYRHYWAIGGAWARQWPRVCWRNAWARHLKKYAYDRLTRSGPQAAGQQRTRPLRRAPVRGADRRRANPHAVRRLAAADAVHAELRSGVGGDPLAPCLPGVTAGLAGQPGRTELAAGAAGTRVRARLRRTPGGPLLVAHVHRRFCGLRP